MSTPWMKFYPRDWRGDQALRAVSIAARGLWMEMLCVMHEASPYGHLVLGGHAVSNAVLARMAGAGVDEVSALLIELESAGVLSRTRKGVIYSRRMVKDGSRAEKGRKAVSKRWHQGAENLREKPQPIRSPSRKPTTQKPEARYSDTNVSGVPPPDPVKALFDLGVAVFEAAGKSKAEARALVGKFRNDLGDARLASLLIEAKSKTDPVGWLQGCKRSKGDERRALYDSINRKFAA